MAARTEMIRPHSLASGAALLARLILGVLFAYAGAVKIWDFTHHTWATQGFFEDIMNYHLLPWDAAMVTAVWLPWVEIFAGGALLIGRCKAGAALLLTGLMAVFTVALTSAWARGLDVSCGCFGHEEAPAIVAHYPLWIGRDLIFFALLAWLTWREGRALKLAPSSVPST